MVLSRPSSPSSPLLGQAPKWLRSSRGIGSPKYIFKITALAFLCIALGWSVTSMYDSNEIQQHGSSKALGTSSEMLEADYGMAEPMEDASGYLDHASALANHRFAPGQTHNAGHPKSSSGSLLHTVSHKISAWNPWDKNGGSEDDATLERLLKSGSVQQTEEVVTSARTRTGEKPIMCKVTIITGGENSVYERALKTHNLHNRIHGYPMHTLRQSILNDVWSKPAYILSVMLRELAKPKSQRVQWLFWVDADTIIINPHVPAEIFLPPHGFNDVHLLVSHDFNGLNNGVFPIRVHPWSVELLSAVLAFPIYRPDENLLFRDQSAMGELLKTPKFARHTVQAPQRWFNAYQGEINETIAPFQTRPGDLLVHFAGVPNRDERMEYWLRRVELHLPEWEIEFKHTSYHTETRQFWDELAGARVGIRRKAEQMKTLSEERTETLKKALEKYNTVLNEEQKGRIDKSMEEMKKVFENEDTKENLDAIREAAEKMREGTKPLQDLLNKENKLLLSTAHTALLSATNLLLLSDETYNATKPESQNLEETITHFKETLLRSPIRAEDISMELEILRQKEGGFKDRLQVVEAEEGRRQRAKEKVEEELRKVEEEEGRAKAVEEEEGRRKLEEEVKASEAAAAAAAAEAESQIQAEAQVAAEEVPSVVVVEDAMITSVVHGSVVTEWVVISAR